MMVVDTWENRHALAQRHVDIGHQVINQQRLIIAKHKSLRLDTKASEDLLAAFERSQEIFEGILARTLQER